MARKKKSIDIQSYKYPSDFTKTQRIAHFLDWLAKKYPRQFAQYNLITRAINGYRRTPGLKTREVELVRSSLTRAKQILSEDYHRGAVTMPSVGVRGTIDDDDRAANELPIKMRRLSSAKRSVERTVEGIDPRKVTDPKIKKWLRTDVGMIMKSLEEANFDVRALPPAEREEKTEA